MLRVFTFPGHFCGFDWLDFVVAWIEITLFRKYYGTTSKQAAVLNGIQMRNMCFKKVLNIKFWKK